MPSDRPYIRFRKSHTSWPEIAYDGPPELGTALNVTVGDPRIVYFQKNGKGVTHIVNPTSPAAPDPAGDPTAQQIGAAAMSHCVVEVLDSGGTATLLSKQAGWGGTMYGGHTPIAIPPTTPLGAQMLMWVVSLDARAKYQQARKFADGSLYWWLWRYLDAAHPWVPPGWELLKFDVTDGGTGNRGLVAGLYGRICQAGDPGSLVNPLGWDFTHIPQNPLDTTPSTVIPAPDPAQPARAGTWVGQLRVYANAAVGRTKMTMAIPAEGNPNVFSDNGEDLYVNRVLPTAPRGADEVVAYPGVLTPPALTGAAHQAQFVALQQDLAPLELPGGLITAPEPAALLEMRAVEPTLNPRSLVLAGPPLAIASRDTIEAGSLAVASIGTGLLVDGGEGEETVVQVAVTGGPETLSSAITLRMHQIVYGVRSDDSSIAKIVRVRKMVGTTPISWEPKDQADMTWGVSLGVDEGFDPLASGGELDAITVTTTVNHLDLVGTPSLPKMVPVTARAGGPLGTSEGVHWDVLRHWEGGSLSDFTFPDQMDHGALVAHPAMQILDGVLTTVDANAVEVFAAIGGGVDYHGDKYQALWTAAGTQGDGTKLRIKVNDGPGGICGLLLNASDRQHGLAFYAWLQRCGWTRDLRLLGSVHYGLDTSGGQNPSELGQNPFPVAGAILDPNDGKPVAYTWGQTPAGSIDVRAVTWMELWRDGTRLVAAIYDNDPDSGAAPIMRQTYQHFTTYAQSQWGAGTSGYWGVTFDTLNPAWTSYAGYPMGLIEATLFQAA